MCYDWYSGVLLWYYVSNIACYCTGAMIGIASFVLCYYVSSIACCCRGAMIVIELFVYVTMYLVLCVVVEVL